MPSDEFVVVNYSCCSYGPSEVYNSVMDTLGLLGSLVYDFGDYGDEVDVYHHFLLLHSYSIGKGEFSIDLLL